MLFHLLTGTTDETLYCGMFVKCHVIMKPGRDYSKGVNCFLEGSGILGWIPSERVTDEIYNDVTDVVKNEDTLLARIFEINKARFSVKVTCRRTDLISNRWDPQRSGDNFLVEDYESYVHPELETPEIEREVMLCKRAIVHPKFRNVDFKGAEDELYPATVAKGAFVFRPASRDYHHLTLTIKFFAELFMHIEIEELEKTNNWSLGKKLKIGEKIYDDLDEIIANFLDPMLTYSESVFDHRRFKAGRRAEIDSYLATSKTVNPKEIVYVIALSYDHPGYFLLCYLPFKRVVREFITVTPKGLRYRKYYFNSADKVINYFKRHWQELQNK